MSTEGGSQTTDEEHEARMAARAERRQKRESVAALQTQKQAASPSTGLARPITPANKATGDHNAMAPSPTMAAAASGSARGGTVGLAKPVTPANKLSPTTATAITNNNKGSASPEQSPRTSASTSPIVSPSTGRATNRFGNRAAPVVEITKTKSVSQPQKPQKPAEPAVPKVAPKPDKETIERRKSQLLLMEQADQLLKKVREEQEQKQQEQQQEEEAKPEGVAEVAKEDEDAEAMAKLAQFDQMLKQAEGLLTKVNVSNGTGGAAAASEEPKEEAVVTAAEDESGAAAAAVPAIVEPEPEAEPEGKQENHGDAVGANNDLLRARDRLEENNDHPDIMKSSTLTFSRRQAFMLAQAIAQSGNNAGADGSAPGIFTVRLTKLQMAELEKKKNEAAIDNMHEGAKMDETPSGEEAMDAAELLKFIDLARNNLSQLMSALQQDEIDCDAFIQLTENDLASVGMAAEQVALVGQFIVVLRRRQEVRRELEIAHKELQQEREAQAQSPKERVATPVSAEEGKKNGEEENNTDAADAANGDKEKEKDGDASKPRKKSTRKKKPSSEKPDKERRRSKVSAEEAATATA